MVLKKESTSQCNKRACTTKHSLKSNTARAVRFSVKPSPELVGDAYLQSTNTRRRYMRRGSRSPSMLAIDAVRSSAEVAEIEAYDLQQEKLEEEQQHQIKNHDSLCRMFRRSFSSHPADQQKAASNQKAGGDAEEDELALSLLKKTNLTEAQKRRLSLEILSRVAAETASNAL